jgi:phage shock protein C
MRETETAAFTAPRALEPVPAHMRSDTLESKEDFRRSVMPFYCQRCGAALPPSARFCSNCGNVITAAPPAPHSAFVRPIAGRNIAGVCIGVAQANGWDVSVVRILVVVGFLFSGGLVGVAYLAGWIGIPEETIAMPSAYPPGTPGAYPPSSYPPGTPGGYPPSV